MIGARNTDLTGLTGVSPPETLAQDDSSKLDHVTGGGEETLSPFITA